MKIRILTILLTLHMLVGCSNRTTNPVLSSSITIQAGVTPALTSTLPSTATMHARPTIVPPPTTSAKATERAIADRYCDGWNGHHPQGLLFSKSRKFMAFVCWPLGGKEISVTKVIALDGSRPPVQVSYRKYDLGINDSQPIPPDIQQGYLLSWIDYFALFPMRWTTDDKFLYLVRASPADGVPYYPNIFSLMRLNVETGEVISALPPESKYFDFSADGTKLLSVNAVKKPLTVTVQNLVTGNEINIRLDKRFDDAGFFRLSPDGSKLLISALDIEKGYSIILADLRLMSQTYLDNRYDYLYMSWVNEHTIYGSGRENGSVFFFYLDTITMHTSPAPDQTPTPSSTPSQ